MFPHIRPADYHYELPDDRIAHYPISPRDHSKLLCYRDGEISHQYFYELPRLLPQGSMLVMNDTRVVPARLIFRRVSGARIEILLLKVLAPSTVISVTMQS